MELWFEDWWLIFHRSLAHMAIVDSIPEPIVLGLAVGPLLLGSHALLDFSLGRLSPGDVIERCLDGFLSLGLADCRLSVEAGWRRRCHPGRRLVVAARQEHSSQK